MRQEIKLFLDLKKKKALLFFNICNLASSSDELSSTSVPQLPQTRWKNIKLDA